MTCSIEYRNIYNSIRNKLLIVDLASEGLTDADREFLVSRSGMMKSGLGLSEKDSKTLSRILVKAFHSDLNSDQVDDKNTRDAIAILENMKLLIGTGEVSKLEGQHICQEISDDLSSNWRKKIIEKITSKRTSSTSDLGRQLNEMIEQYVNSVNSSQSLSKVTEIFNDFSTKSTALFLNYKHKFFIENGIDEKLDFVISPDMKIDDLYMKLNTAKNSTKKSVSRSIEELIAQYSSTVDKQLSPLLSGIKKYYINLLESDNESIEQIKRSLNASLQEIKKNEKVYINRINKCKALHEMVKGIASIKIRSRVNELSHSIYSDEFDKEIASLEDDVELIKAGKFGDKVTANVKKNYLQALSSSNGTIQDDMDYTTTYREFLYKIEEYNNGKIGIDSLYELNDLFKDKEHDKKIMAYVKGDYNAGDRVNLDLVMLKESKYGTYSLVYRTDSEFLGNRSYGKIAISGLALLDKDADYDMHDAGNLTEFICNSTLDGTQYSDNENYFNVLGIYNGTCLIYKENGKIDFKKIDEIAGRYQRVFSTPSKRYRNIDSIATVVATAVAKDLTLSKMLKGDNISSITENKAKS